MMSNMNTVTFRAPNGDVPPYLLVRASREFVKDLQEQLDEYDVEYTIDVCDYDSSVHVSLKYSGDALITLALLGAGLTMCEKSIPMIQTHNAYTSITIWLRLYDFQRGE